MCSRQTVEDGQSSLSGPYTSTYTGFRADSGTSERVTVDESGRAAAVEEDQDLGRRWDSLGGVCWRQHDKGTTAVLGLTRSSARFPGEC